MNLEIKIQQKLQETNYDCGQTCLEMLGYDGYGMFNGREMDSNDFRSLQGVEEVTVPIGQEENLDYSFPHIWLILPKARFVSGTSAHFVIRHRDQIYCPRVGTVNYQEYKQKYVGFVLQEFLVPFKR